MYRKYYSSSGMPQLERQGAGGNAEKHPSAAAKTETVKEKCREEALPLLHDADDLILIAVILILFADGCDDKLLLLALGLIFLNK